VRSGVALKILPDSFNHDGERVARFQREAHVLASLNHPNIGAIYGFEEASARQILVLELVEGEHWRLASPKPAVRVRARPRS
jgi:serine/threonine protein kinase